MNNLQVIEREGVRVLTTQQLATEYGSDSKVISNNFNNNKERYQEGKHYILLQGDELRQFKSESSILGIAPNLNKLYLWTEKGALLHAKSLNTDKAWEVYEILVDTYFNVKKPASAMEFLELQFAALKEVDNKLSEVDKDLQTFKKDMPLLGLEMDKITYAKNKKIVPLLGGKQSLAYKDKSLRTRVYRDLESQIWRQFDVKSYKAIKRSQCDLVIAIINRYELPYVLKEEIEECNNQMCLV